MVRRQTLAHERLKERGIASKLDQEGFKDHSASRLKRALLLLKEHGVLEIAKRARQHGLKASVGFIARNIRHSIAANASKRFDRARGVDTAGSLQLEYLTIESPNAVHGTEAVSTSAKSFDWMLKNIPRPLSDYTFIDIGCGKGRTLILSRNYGFHRAIGVEFALELVETAQRNLVTINQVFPGGVSVVHKDAAQYEFPRSPLVVYLYNPFGPEVMAKVIQNIADHLSSCADDCYVIYGSSNAATLTWFEPLLTETDLFEQSPTEPMPLFWDAVRTIHYCVYRRKKDTQASHLQ
jgi:predicted RNA methylase